MNLRELFFENISLSKHKSDIEAAFKEAYRLTLSDCAFKQTYGYLKSNQFLQYTVEVNLARRLIATLQAYINDILSDSKAFIFVKFLNLKVLGYAEFNSMVLNKQIIPIIAKDLHQSLLNSLIDDGIVGEGENGKDTILDQNALIKYIRSFVYNPSYEVHPLISNTIDTIIHEMVHIQQHVKQQHRDGETEYRSYLAKKPKFHDTINRIHRGEHSELDSKIYHASPQEITAHAHDAALEIISLISNDSDENPRGILANLDELFIDNDFAKSTPRLRYYLSVYNKNDPKEYKVYKRFIKTVAQEIFAYRQKLNSKIEPENGYD